MLTAPSLQGVLALLVPLEVIMVLAQLEVLVLLVPLEVYTRMALL